MGQVPEKNIPAIDAAVERSFNPQRLEARLHNDIGKNRRTEEVRTLLNRLESTLGKKLTRLEEDAAGAAAQKEMHRTLPQLTKDPAHRNA